MTEPTPLEDLRSSSEGKTGPSSRGILVLSLLLLALGTLLRLSFYLLARPPLWGDEAMLAVSFSQSPISWLHGLSFNQTAPLGYLFLSWSVVRLFGDGVLALRLVPFLAGVGSLFLYQRLARRAIPGSWSVVAVALLALSATAIYYSGEVKQYSLDLLTATGLTLAVLPRPMTEERARWAALAAFAAVVFSQASVFVLTGAAVWLWFQEPGAGRRLGVLFGVVACAGYLLYSRTMSPVTGALMDTFWADTFLPLRLDPGTWWRAFTGLFGHVLGTPLPWIAGGVAVWGALGGRDRRLASLLALPLVVATVASLLQLYPFSPLRDGPRMGRLFLFALPGLTLLLTLGFRRLAKAGPVLAAIVLVLVGEQGFRTVTDPQTVFYRPDITRAISLIRAHPDTVVVPPHILPLIRYYSAREGLDLEIRPAVE
ncbi:MAG: glycosyltransferase family 39 protein, partial [Gemmatimonadota bacterium]